MLIHCLFCTYTMLVQYSNNACNSPEHYLFCTKRYSFLASFHPSLLPCSSAFGLKPPLKVFLYLSGSILPYRRYKNVLIKTKYFLNHTSLCPLYGYKIHLLLFYITCVDIKSGT